MKLTLTSLFLFAVATLLAPVTSTPSAKLDLLIGPGISRTLCPPGTHDFSMFNCRDNCPETHIFAGSACHERCDKVYGENYKDTGTGCQRPAYSVSRESAWKCPGYDMCGYYNRNKVCWKSCPEGANPVCGMCNFWADYKIKKWYSPALRATYDCLPGHARHDIGTKSHKNRPLCVDCAVHPGAPGCRSAA